MNETHEYHKKLMDELMLYVPLLDEVIKKLENSSGSKGENHLNTVRQLKDLICDKKRRLKSETAEKCLNIILRIKDQVEKSCSKPILEINRTDEKLSIVEEKYSIPDSEKDQQKMLDDCKEKSDLERDESVSAPLKEQLYIKSNLEECRNKLKREITKISLDCLQNDNIKVPKALDTEIQIVTQQYINMCSITNVEMLNEINKNTIEKSISSEKDDKLLNRCRQDKSSSPSNKDSVYVDIHKKKKKHSKHDDYNKKTKHDKNRKKHSKNNKSESFQIRCEKDRDNFKKRERDSLKSRHESLECEKLIKTNIEDSDSLEKLIELKKKIKKELLQSDKKGNKDGVNTSSNQNVVIKSKDEKKGKSNTQIESIQNITEIKKDQSVHVEGIKISMPKNINENIAKENVAIDSKDEKITPNTQIESKQNTIKIKKDKNLRVKEIKTSTSKSDDENKSKEDYGIHDHDLKVSNEKIQEKSIRITPEVETSMPKGMNENISKENSIFHDKNTEMSNCENKKKDITLQILEQLEKKENSNVKSSMNSPIDEIKKLKPFTQTNFEQDVLEALKNEIKDTDISDISSPLINNIFLDHRETLHSDVKRVIESCDSKKSRRISFEKYKEKNLPVSSNDDKNINDSPICQSTIDLINRALTPKEIERFNPGIIRNNDTEFNTNIKENSKNIKEENSLSDYAGPDSPDSTSSYQYLESNSPILKNNIYTCDEESVVEPPQNYPVNNGTNFPNQNFSCSLNKGEFNPKVNYSCNPFDTTGFTNSGSNSVCGINPNYMNKISIEYGSLSPDDFNNKLRLPNINIGCSVTRKKFNVDFPVSENYRGKNPKPMYNVNPKTNPNSINMNLQVNYEYNNVCNLNVTQPDYDFSHSQKNNIYKAKCESSKELSLRKSSKPMNLNFTQTNTFLNSPRRSPLLPTPIDQRSPSPLLPAPVVLAQNLDRQNVDPRLNSYKIEKPIENRQGQMIRNTQMFNSNLTQFSSNSKDPRLKGSLCNKEVWQQNMSNHKFPENVQHSNVKEDGKSSLCNKEVLQQSINNLEFSEKIKHSGVKEDVKGSLCTKEVLQQNTSNHEFIEDNKYPSAKEDVKGSLCNNEVLQQNMSNCDFSEKIKDPSVKEDVKGSLYNNEVSQRHTSVREYAENDKHLIEKKEDIKTINIKTTSDNILFSENLSHNSEHETTRISVDQRTISDEQTNKYDTGSVQIKPGTVDKTVLSIDEENKPNKQKLSVSKETSSNINLEIEIDNGYNNIMTESNIESTGNSENKNLVLIEENNKNNTDNKKPSIVSEHSLQPPLVDSILDVLSNKQKLKEILGMLNYVGEDNKKAEKIKKKLELLKDFNSDEEDFNENKEATKNDCTLNDSTNSNNRKGKKAKFRNEVELLRNALPNTFINEGGLNVTGIRMCRLQKFQNDPVETKRKTRNSDGKKIGNNSKKSDLENKPDKIDKPTKIENLLTDNMSIVVEKLDQENNATQNVDDIVVKIKPCPKSKKLSMLKNMTHEKNVSLPIKPKLKNKPCPKSKKTLYYYDSDNSSSSDDDLSIEETVQDDEKQSSERVIRDEVKTKKKVIKRKRKNNWTLGKIKKKNYKKSNMSPKIDKIASKPILFNENSQGEIDKNEKQNESETLQKKTSDVQPTLNITQQTDEVDDTGVFSLSVKNSDISNELSSINMNALTGISIKEELIDNSDNVCNLPINNISIKCEPRSGLNDDELLTDLYNNMNNDNFNNQLSDVIYNSMKECVVGGLQVRRNVNGLVEYLCMINGCKFSSNSYLSLNSHVDSLHSKLLWNGYCQECQKFIYNHAVSYTSALDHIASDHVEYQNSLINEPISSNVNIEENTNVNANENYSVPQICVLSNVTSLNRANSSNIKNGSENSQTVYSTQEVGIFVCADANCNEFSTDSAHVFVLHIKRHSLSRPLSVSCTMCIYCKSDFNNADLLCQHIIQEHGHCQYKCSDCTFRGASYIIVFSHSINVHANKTNNSKRVVVVNPFPKSDFEMLTKGILSKRDIFHPYICNVETDIIDVETDNNIECGKPFHSYSSFFVHLQNEHVSTKNLCCSCCVGSVMPIKNLIKHLQEKHPQYFYKCAYCDFGADTQGSILHHLLINHKFRLAIFYRAIFYEDYKDVKVMKVNMDNNINYHISNIFDIKMPKIDAPKYDKFNTENSLLENVHCDSPSNFYNSFIENDNVINHNENDFATDVIMVDSDEDIKPDICKIKLQNSPKKSLKIEQTKRIEQSSEMLSDNILLNVDATKPNAGLTGIDLLRCGNRSCSFCCDDFEIFISHLNVCNANNNQVKSICFHCEKLFDYPRNLLVHISVHGIPRYQCSICDLKFRSRMQCLSHLRYKHSVQAFETKPVNPNKSNQNTDNFIVYPRNTKDDQLHSIITKETNSDSIKYGLNDISKLPSEPILNHSIYCAICSYNTKVTSNMQRHLQSHASNATVPAAAPVNPVPHLETNEKYFDKMTNLALSSNMDKQVKSCSISYLNVPSYVCMKDRYVCGSQYCQYISLNENMLRQHWETLHRDEDKFFCVHCSGRCISAENSNISFTQTILTHLQLHDATLYHCVQCDYMHPSMHNVRNHHFEVHNKTAEPECIREILDINRFLWHCTYCQYSNPKKTEVLKHLQNDHVIKRYFKCSLCQFSSDFEPSVKRHQCMKHNNKGQIVRSVYKKRMDSTDKATSWNDNRKRGSQFIEGNSSEETCGQSPKMRKLNDGSHAESIDDDRSMMKHIQHNVAQYNANVIVNFDEITFNEKKYAMINQFFCEICKKYSSSDIESFRIHLIEELDYRKWECKSCGYKTFDLDRISSHSLSEHRAVCKGKELEPNLKIENWILKYISIQREHMPTSSSTEAPEGIRTLSKLFSMNQNKPKETAERTSRASQNKINVNENDSSDDEGKLIIDDTDHVTNDTYIEESGLRASCKLCNFVGKVGASIKLHITKTHSFPCVCKYCSKQFQTEMALLDHHNAKHRNEKFIAPIKPVSFIKKKAKKVLVCLICRKKMIPIAIATHKLKCKSDIFQNTILDKDETILKCIKCKKIYPDEIAMQLHYIKEHNSVKSQFIEKKLSSQIVGTDVSFQPINISSVLPGASTKEKGPDIFYCCYCCRGFTKFFGFLRHHSVSHSDRFLLLLPLTMENIKQTGEIKKTTEFNDCDCVISSCKRTFEDYDSLRKHVRSHYCEFFCPLCVKPFQFKDVYLNHIKQISHLNHVSFSRENEVADRLKQIDLCLDIIISKQSELNQSNPMLAMVRSNSNESRIDNS